MFAKSYIDLTEAMQLLAFKKGRERGGEGEEDTKDEEEEEGDDKGMAEYENFMVDAEYLDVEC